MCDKIKVVVKVRPLVPREIEDNLSHQWCVRNDTLYQLDSNGIENGTSFTFDKVYDEGTKTAAVYNDVAKPIVEAATAGFNGTIFAYGQTSSGKTYTMSGTDDSPGIIPLAVFNLFEKIKSIPDRDFLVRISYIEIYNECVNDLLNSDKKDIKIMENLHEGGVKADATERMTPSPEEVLQAMKEGEARRQTGATNMNEDSSRSHSIFQIIIESREHVEDGEAVTCVNVAKLNLVDLAGSERAGQAGATGQRFREGTHINKSLSTLALVIKQLSEPPVRHVSYRDTKLTRILQDSLGGNAKTSIICAITPASVDETISTLQFASRAKVIKNKPQVNAVATSDAMIQTLTKKLYILQSQLESKKNIEQTNNDLKKQIANLRGFILNGFQQRRSNTQTVSRKKNQQLRRATISTYNLNDIEEDHTPSVPKFCTPILKYNPLALPNSSEFQPIQSKSKLPVVEEETSRQVTPPPPERRVNFNDDVIELDSDDDVSSDTQPCSPYHKCYQQSKTPPCVLRKHAKNAEKSLKDLVELTEMEKMYTPEVVDLMTRLETYKTNIDKLEEQLAVINSKSSSKDSEISILKDKVSKSEENIRSLTDAKLDLETRCQNFITKITDWEVTYETLKNKTKTREDELLHLLEEKERPKKSIDIGAAKPFQNELTNFMDLSKDISLINSDNESSIINPSDDEAYSSLKDLIADLHKQLNNKNETIAQLESSLLASNNTILKLEKIVQENDENLAVLNDKLSNHNEECSVYKSTINTLNSTIQNQKALLETANSDMDSYNGVIQELHIKLSRKDNMLNVSKSDSVLELMVASEDKLLSNNENMRNIIQSFKVALESRTTEINILKSQLEKTNMTASVVSNDDLNEQLKTKEVEMAKLNSHIDSMKERINKLTDENKVLKEHAIRHEEKYNELFAISNRLQGKTNKNELLLDKLQQCNIELQEKIQEDDAKLVDYSIENNKLLENIEELKMCISKLEADINLKKDVINLLEEQNKESQNNIHKAKLTVHKVQDIFRIITGNIKEVPSVMGNFVEIFNLLTNSLDVLEHTVSELVKKNEQKEIMNLELCKKIASLKERYDSEIVEFELKIEKFGHEERKLHDINEKLATQIGILTEEVNATRSELEATKKTHDKNTDLALEMKRLQCELKEKDERINKFQSKINDFEKDIQTLQTNILSKESELLSLKDNNFTLETTIENLQLKETLLKDTFMSNKASSDQVLHDKELEIARLKNDLNNMHEKYDTEIENLARVIQGLKADIENKNYGMESILKKCTKIADYLDVAVLEKCDNIATYDKIDCIFDKLLSELASVKMVHLKNRRRRSGGDQGSIDIVTEKSDIKKVEEDLECREELITLLQEQLKMKSMELEGLKYKVKKLNDQFKNYEFVMKQQKEEMHIDNNIIKKKFLDMHSSQEHNGVNTRFKSPQSLVKMSTKKIMELMQYSETALSLNSENNLRISNVPMTLDCCKCSQLSLDLKATSEENLNLLSMIEEIEIRNKELLEEQAEVRNELELLLGPAQELQKKILNHRTNMSTLTATSYAENRLLKSQVTVLHHYFNRFHNFCQRDIPSVKKQLQDLLVLLRADSSSPNNSFKRFSLPCVLDNNSSLLNSKNESIIDSDLLMLDTNITLTTCADNTLLGQDQTCFDVTQTYFSVDAACQTNDESPCYNSDIENIHNTMPYTYTISDMIEKLQNENKILKDDINRNLQKYSSRKKDIQTSPIKNADFNKEMCENCENSGATLKQLQQENEILEQELSDLKIKKEDIDNKYQNLTLELISTDQMVKKWQELEKEFNKKVNEISSLNCALANKNKEIKDIQDENDTLSTQLMESISEIDDLRKELDKMNKINANLPEKLCEIEVQVNDKNVSDSCQSSFKEQRKPVLDTHLKLNRSLSDSECSSSYDKFCTLQSELNACKGDCKELSEECATINYQLQHNNLSICPMDMEDSVEENNIFSFTKELNTITESANKTASTLVPENTHLDLYQQDKVECYNFLIEKTGTEKENLNYDLKIIEVIKMFYNNILLKHNNDIQNYINQLKEQKESNELLEKNIYNLSQKNSEVTTLFNMKEDKTNSLIAEINDNIIKIKETVSTMSEDDKNSQIVTMFKGHILELLDKEYNISTSNLFENLISNLINSNQMEFNRIMKQYTQLQQQMADVSSEFDLVNKNLQQVKKQLSDRDNEYALLNAQKERVHEISNCVTLDIIRKERELSETISKGCEKLLECNIMHPDDVKITLPLTEHVEVLFERIVNQWQNKNTVDNEKGELTLEVKKSKTVLSEKEEEIKSLQRKNLDIVKEIENLTHTLTKSESNLVSQQMLNEELRQVYESKSEENEANLKLIDQLSDKIKALKDVVNAKEACIDKLETEIKNDKQKNLTEFTDFVNKIENLVKEKRELNDINEMLLKEKEAGALELDHANKAILELKAELEKMTSHIAVLRESVQENNAIAEQLRSEAKSLHEQNLMLKENYDRIVQDCSRLETNIKTHEKTAEIQSKIIIRLKKQKEEDEKIVIEKEKHIEDLMQKCEQMQKECETIRLSVNASKEFIDVLKNAKVTLESRVKELETEVESGRHRSCLTYDASRRRRQSLHDSKRMFSEVNHGESVVADMFESRAHPDDLFMDVDEDNSNRGSPARLSKGRDSFGDHQSDEDPISRPSSVQATRRRRQSVHDLHRSTLTHTPPLSGSKLVDEIQKLKSAESSVCNTSDSEISILRERLSACQQELEELKEKYKELDEECETCAQYLRERDDHCARLLQERRELQQEVSGLQDKLRAGRSQGEPPLKYTNVAVNTDEDWANLHSVVVDRMSFDAEVEKNKRLTKTIEELRYNKRDLKATIAKMEKMLERNTKGEMSKELHHYKSQLESCRTELEVVRERCKELDEECDTCAQYLRERDEQCRLLRDARDKLQQRLQELQDELGADSVLNARKKRRSIHDQNRPSAGDVTDTNDLSTHDSSNRSTDETQTRELKHLQATVDKLTQQKASLETQLASVTSTQVYVATGSAIVQNQQLTDVMKENQKLKKINAKLITLCKKRGKSVNESNKENDSTTDQF